MEDILIIRESIISFYRKFETYISFVLRFLAGVIIFSIINNIGFVREEFVQYVSAPVSLPYTMMLSLLFAITPFVFGYFLMMVAVTIQISASIEVALLTLLVMLCIMFLYVRLAPKKCILIIATILAFYFKVPYVVPIFVGLYMGVVSVIPVSIGIFIWSFIPSVGHLLRTTETAGLDLMELSKTFVNVFVEFLSQMSSNTSWVFIAFIFALTILVVYAISHTSINYASDLAIVIGAILCFLCYVIAVILAGLEINILMELLFIVISALIMWVVRFFDIVLDYGRAERVQFEDEEYYYYVKTVPKAVVVKPTKVVKRIKPDPEETTDYEENPRRKREEIPQEPVRRRYEEPTTRIRREESTTEMASRNTDRREPSVSRRIDQQSEIDLIRKRREELERQRKLREDLEKHRR